MSGPTKSAPSMETSAELKAELSLLLPARACCQRSELQALAQARQGALDGRWLAIRTPINAVARKLVRLARSAGVEATEIRRGATLRRPTYTVRLAVDAALATALLAPAPADRPCCCRAFLRGAVLAAGTLVTPARGYHFEFALPTAAAAAAVTAALGSFELVARRYRRGARWVVYVKGADAIVRCLSLVGANRAVLAFEGFRVVQEMRAQVNRRTNSETANMSKSIRTALEQTAEVRRWQASGLLDRLPGALRTAATIRLAYPRAGLRELASRLSLTKSAMNGRLRRLRAWARTHGSSEQAHPRGAGRMDVSTRGRRMRWR